MTPPQAAIGGPGFFLRDFCFVTPPLRILIPIFPYVSKTICIRHASCMYTLVSIISPKHCQTSLCFSAFVPPPPTLQDIATRVHFISFHVSWAGPGWLQGRRTPLFGPLCRLFNSGPKVGPPPGSIFLLEDLRIRWTPFSKNPGSATFRLLLST